MLGALRSYERLVKSAYETAGECPGCDPRHLAYGLGLLPCPSAISAPSVSDYFLLYPQDADCRERGLSIFSALARWLLRDPVPLGLDARSVTAELVVPAGLARHATLGSIAFLQPHAPIAFLHFALLSHDRQMTAGKYR